MNNINIDTSNAAEQKVWLAQTILSLEDTTKLAQIQYFVQSILEPIEQEEVEEEEEENDYDAKQLTFEEWNEQFDDTYELDDFLPEYNMTVREFRQSIYDSERGPGMSFDEFVTKLNNLS